MCVCGGGVGIWWLRELWLHVICSWMWKHVPGQIKDGTDLSRPQSRAVGQDATACNPVGCRSLGDQAGLSPGGKLPAWWTGRWGPLCWCPRDNKDFRKDSPDSGLKEALVSCLAA